MSNKNQESIKGTALMAYWMGLHFAVFFLLSYPFFWILLSRPAWYPYAHQLRRLWGRYIFFFSCLRTQVEYEEPLDKDKLYVFTPNHSSYLDIPAVTIMLPGYFIFMAKAELLQVPLFKIFFKTIDIAVHRKSAIKAHRSMIEAGERIKKGASIINFPEGTISEEAPQLGRFKDGPFHLAIEMGVDIVPITMPDNYKRLPDKGKLMASSGKVRMYVHKAIPTQGLTLDDVDRIKNEVYSIIEKKLEEYESGQ